jgi:hypothetical protein
MPTACWHERRLLFRRLLAFGLLYGSMLFLLLQLYAEAAGKGAAGSLENMLPGINEISGWQRSGASYAYTPEKLYNYIDGAADQFIAYGFVKLHGAEYVCTADQKEGITVDIYDMGSALSAFGMFTSKKDPASAGLGIGAESFGNEQFSVFYKGRFYVEIQARIIGDRNRSVPQTAARMVADRIPGGNSKPEILGLLPAFGHVPGSENYMVGGVLGHAFLPRGIARDYRRNQELIKASIVLFPGAAQAGAAFVEYNKYLAGAGEKVIPRAGVGEKSFTAHEQYQKNIFAALMGNYIVCVTGLSNVQTGEQLAQEILGAIQQSGRAQVPAN